MSTSVFFGIYWSTKPEVKAEIWYGYPDSDQIIKSKIVIGEEIHIRVLAERYCIGTEQTKGEWITCKERRRRDGEQDVTHNYRFKFLEEASEKDKQDKNVQLLLETKNYLQCYKCSNVEFFSCRMICSGDTCNPSSDLAQLICLPPKTSIYLTHVGNEVKVGVSLGIPRRWIEQGSDLATVIATAPGLEARRLEQYISTKLGYKLQVRNSTKLQNLNKVNLSNSYKELNEAINNVKPLINDILAEIPGYTERKPKIMNLQEHYGNLNFSSPIQSIEVDPGIEFGGKIVALKGSLLIVNQGDYHYAIDLKKLISKEFEFLDRPAKIATQSYLDQWF